MNRLFINYRCQEYINMGCCDSSNILTAIVLGAIFYWVLAG